MSITLKELHKRARHSTEWRENQGIQVAFQLAGYAEKLEDLLREGCTLLDSVAPHEGEDRKLVEEFIGRCAAIL